MAREHNFETNIQRIKYLVLESIARAYFNNTFIDEYLEIPSRIIPGPKPSMRCCIYKERAIVEKRMKLALGGNKKINNVIEVLEIACDECPLGGYNVTDHCRGCIAHRCEKACHKNAITFDEKTRMAIIDKDKCVNCGMCAKACQYNAIVNYLRPCEQACKVGAIHTGEDSFAHIDDDKCIQCGACVYQCPFGAIMDKSYIVDVIKLLVDSNYSKKYPVYALTAPSIASQFRNKELGRVISAIKALGFTNVVEAALGADMVAYKEAKELAEKGFLTSSCCPTFVSFIEKCFPTLKEHVSSNLSPMATIAKAIKEREPNAKIVFIGPCIAKKAEIKREEVKPYVDYVLTFEELAALIDAKDIDINSLEISPYQDASYFGRVFARTGGLIEAVEEALKEQNSDFKVVSLRCDGMEGLKLALNKAKNGNLDGVNFIEGMACLGGCISGPCSLSHELRDKFDVDKVAKASTKESIEEAIKNRIK